MEKNHQKLVLELFRLYDMDSGITIIKPPNTDANPRNITILASLLRAYLSYLFTTFAIPLKQAQI